MKRRLILIAAILAIVALIAFTLAKNKKAINASNKVVDRSSIAIPVSVMNVQDVAITGTFIQPAVVQPVEEANISINASGKLKNGHCTSNSGSAPPRSITSTSPTDRIKETISR